MPRNDSLAIRRVILELVGDRNLFEKLDSHKDEISNHPQKRLKLLAIRQLAQLRLELKKELIDYGRSGKRGELLRLLDQGNLPEIAKTIPKDESSSFASSDVPSTSSSTPKGQLFSNELPKPMVPSFIPALDVGSAQEKPKQSPQIGTIKEFRNVIQVFQIPDFSKKASMNRTFDVTRNLSDETTPSSSPTSIQDDRPKEHQAIRELLEKLKQRELERSSERKASTSQASRLIPTVPIGKPKRDEAIQCDSFRKEKKDANTSPIDEIQSALSDYTKAFDDDFSNSQPSSDPSIGQIRLEAVELSSRRVISIRPDGSIVQKKPRVYESEEDSPQSISTEVDSSDSRSEEVVSCMNARWRAGSRMLRLDLTDLSSSAIETVSARGNESLRGSVGNFSEAVKTPDHRESS